jgi:hypothetical protein
MGVAGRLDFVILDPKRDVFQVEGRQSVSRPKKPLANLHYFF